MWQPGMSLEDVERDAILKAFEFFRGNKTQTANSLGIAIRTLDSKLDKYGAKNIYDQGNFATAASGKTESAQRETGKKGSKKSAALRADEGLRVEQNAKSAS